MKYGNDMNNDLNKNLKYPILLIHGMGFRDNKKINYWGRIPDELERLGCKIFYGYQDSAADIETNGQTIVDKIDKIIEKTGSEKVNIIAHSKGGLDSRYAISTLHAGNKVASLTTISSPHNGSKTVDKLMKFPKPLIKFVACLTNFWFRLLGDKQPDSYKVFQSFTTKAAEKFNLDNPDAEGVYYQSYAFAMKNPFSDIFMWLPNLVVGVIEGENDGLLTPESVKWSNFKGVYYGVENRGISHCDEVDMRRRRFSKKSGNGVSDIIDIYKNIICELSEMGF